MTNMRIDSATTTNMNNIVPNFAVSNANAELLVYSVDWLKWRGYYESVPELASVIDKKALYTVGKGYKASDKTKKTLDKIRGFGKDTANSIFYNAVRVYTIGGDFYAEIIKNKRGELTNLKPLNPGSIKIIANEFGIVTHYEQWNDKEMVSSFTPDEIFHLAWNRLADAIHGIPTISKLEDTIKAKKEAMNDLQIVFHRYVKPLIISEVDTDDAAEIAAYKTKLDNSVKNGENLIVPKGTVSKIERISIPQYSTLDPLPWINYLNRDFIVAEGVPDVILGDGKETTEASAKILYVAFQQMVEWNQLFLEEQIKAQLGLDVEFEFPADLIEDLKQDNKKDSKPNKEKKSEVSP